MSYEENWKVLADLLTELRKKGEKIPTDVMNDLRSAKTMIQILKADPTHIENIPRIETYLRNVESYAILMAQEKLGTGFVEQWLRKLEKARKTKIEEKEEVTPRFVPGLPRIKIGCEFKFRKMLPGKMLKALSRKTNFRAKCKGTDIC